VATIWVIDDEVSVSDVLSAMLQQMGYDVRVFNDAREAVAAFRPDQVDAVLTDLRMPTMDGLAVVRALRQKDPQAVILILTGFPSVADGVEAIRLGAADYLTKPFRMEEIRLRLLRALEMRDVQGRLRRSRILAWLLIGSLPFWFGLGLALHLLLGCP
jgi:DNA-binding NtrC family response regulator